MSRHRPIRTLPPLLGLFISLAAVMAPTASADVSVSRAEVSGTKLRLEGRAVANRAITVDGVRMATSDGSGAFRIARDPYTRPADCTVDVNDGSAVPTNARLSGCTVTSSTSPTLSTLGLSPTSVAGGASSTGTVTLSAAAPSGGQSVALSSSNSSVAGVPASVTVAAGATSAAFTVTTAPVAGDSSATITATGGGVSRSAVLTVTTGAGATPTPASLTLDPAAVVEGATSTGTVALTGAAPTGGLVVALSSGNATAATVPSSVTVAGGATSATFTVQAGTTAGTSSSVITASAGGVSRTATLTVNSSSPTLSNLSLDPLSVQGGSPSTGTVTLTAPATAGGVTVSLASGNAQVATVPDSVTVVGGASTATFTVATSAVSASTSALITATHGSATKSFTLAVTPAATGPAVSEVALSASTVVGGTPVTGTVRLVSAAPSGGQPVALSSDNTAAATVPASVTVAAGATQATFPVETKPVTNSTSSTIVAEAGGARRGATITVTPHDTANVITPDVAQIGPGFVGADFTDHSTTTTTMTFGPDTLGPVRWEIIEGALPGGLALKEVSPGFTPAKDIHEAIAGTPTTEGSRTFTIRATDANGQTATRTYTITINPPLALAITPQQWPTAKVGEFTNLWIDGSGGVKPYRWTVSAGALPPGMSLVQDNPDGPLVRVTGTPTAAGTFGFTLRLTDAQNATVTRALSVTVEPAAPAPAALSSLALNPTSVTGGASSTGTVTLDRAAPAGGASVSLSSANTAAATVPASVTVAEGSTSATFTVATSAVSATTSSTISALHAGVTRTATLAVNAPATSADTVSISRVEYESGKQTLRVEAASSSSGATLRAHVSATDALIGTLSAGRGEFPWSTNPQSVTVRSSLGGSATRAVTLK